MFDTILFHSDEEIWVHDDAVCIGTTYVNAANAIEVASSPAANAAQAIDHFRAVSRSFCSIFQGVARAFYAFLRLRSSSV